jgi:AmmeMemoRadiSam system protein A
MHTEQAHQGLPNGTANATPAVDVRGPVLLALARAAITNALCGAMKDDASAAWLQEPGACFVTLTQLGELRGCIGSLQARRSLLADVRANAVAAALQDPRFAPLTMAELAHTGIEVSVLSPTTPMTFTNEADALSQLRPGIDGVVLACRGLRSTFLPQVWEQLPDAVRFMAHLKQKAGLPPDFWSPSVQLQRYTVSKFSEECAS